MSGDPWAELREAVQAAADVMAVVSDKLDALRSGENAEEPMKRLTIDIPESLHNRMDALAVVADKLDAATVKPLSAASSRPPQSHQ